jgi:DNA polymerase
MDKQRQLAAIRTAISRHGCSLRSGCIQPVPGEGAVDAEVMFIGEAPGAKEDAQGRPFVGASGRLLDKGLTLAGLERSNVYITNVVKCRPPGNRKPTTKEIDEHRPLLERELDLISPLLIVPLGLTAVRFFLPKARLADVQSRIEHSGRWALFATYHPGATFRYQDKREVFLHDIASIPALLEQLRAS